MQDNINLDELHARVRARRIQLEAETDGCQRLLDRLTAMRDADTLEDRTRPADDLKREAKYWRYRKWRDGI